jgi:thioredoxin 2
MSTREGGESGSLRRGDQPVLKIVDGGGRDVGSGGAWSRPERNDYGLPARPAVPMIAFRHVVCPHCAAVNRLPADKPACDARCGGCHRALFEGRPLSVGPANFDKHRRKNDIAVLVEVWAPWCGPCRAMALMFEKAAAELRPGVRLIKLNADYEPRIASELGSRAFLLCCCCAADGLWPERQA